MTQVPAIEVKQLQKNYGPIQALKDVSFQVPHGAVGLLGPNGSGKSTFMKILMGLLKHQKGTILVEGKNRTKIQVREMFGYMPENDCQFPGLSGLMAVAYAGELAGLPYWDALKRADQILGYVGLGEAYHRPVGEYSTGMKQRIKLAQALIHDPPYLLLDEPTNGMDPKGRFFMLDLIKDLKKTGKTIMMSSHLLKDVEEICEHVVVLHKGKLLLEGSIQALKEKQHQRYVVKLREEDEVDSWVKRIESQGVQVERGQAGEIWFNVPPPARLLFEAAKEEQVEIRQLQKKVQSLEEIFMEALKNFESNH